MEKKIQKKFSDPIISFRDNCIWIGYVKLYLLRREYMSLAVNMLTRGLKTSYITKRDFFQLNSLHSDQ